MSVLDQIFLTKVRFCSWPCVSPHLVVKINFQQFIFIIFSHYDEPFQRYSRHAFFGHPVKWLQGSKKCDEVIFEICDLYNENGGIYFTAYPNNVCCHVGSYRYYITYKLYTSLLDKSLSPFPMRDKLSKICVNMT